MEVQLGTTGAKRVSYRSPNPRDLLRSVVDANPGQTEDSMLRLFVAALDVHPDYVPAIIEYWFTNNYRSMKSRRGSHAPMVAAKAAQARGALQAHIEDKAKIILLDLILPHGQRLRDASGADCALAGGWYSAIAKRIGMRKVVGRTLSEAALRKLFDQWHAKGRSR